MDPIFYSIGNIDIRWYSICLLLGAIMGMFFFSRESKRFKFDSDFIFNLSFWCIIFGFIGARLYYVAFNYDAYSEDLISIFKIWNGGLAIHGGILFGLITAFVYCRKYNANAFKVFDMASFSLILAQAIGRWGNFFNSEAYGSVVSKADLIANNIPMFIIDGMKINNNYHHPTFYYEFLWCIAGFVFLYIMRRFKFLKVSQLTSLYLMWYSVGRFYVESLRTDSLMMGAFKAAQVASVFMFVAGFIILLLSFRKSKYEGLYNALDDVVMF